MLRVYVTLALYHHWTGVIVVNYIVWGGRGRPVNTSLHWKRYLRGENSPPSPYSVKVSITVLRIFERHCRIRYATLKTGLNIAISCHKLSIAFYTDISIDAKEPQETLESQDEPMSVDSETRDQNRPPDGQDSETKMDEELTESTKGQDGKSSCASCTI